MVTVSAFMNTRKTVKTFENLICFLFMKMFSLGISFLSYLLVGDNGLCLLQIFFFLQKLAYSFIIVLYNHLTQNTLTSLIEVNNQHWVERSLIKF